MQTLDTWESHFHEWKRERREQEMKKNRDEENRIKLIEFEKKQIEEIKDAKNKDVYHILGLMYQRKRMILLLLFILIILYLFLTFLH